MTMANRAEGTELSMVGHYPEAKSRLSWTTDRWRQRIQEDRPPNCDNSATSQLVKPDQGRHHNIAVHHWGTKSALQHEQGGRNTSLRHCDRVRLYKASVDLSGVIRSSLYHGKKCTGSSNYGNHHANPTLDTTNRMEMPDQDYESYQLLQAIPINTTTEPITVDSGVCWQMIHRMSYDGPEGNK